METCAVAAAAESGAPARPRAFLFVDVDGYCASGVDQRVIVSPAADGYRARELGWAYYVADDHASGSIYFRDVHVPPFAVGQRGYDAGVLHAHRIHGLPIEPGALNFAGEIVMCSSRLLEAIRVVHDAVAHVTGAKIVFVHKGGNEGLWTGRAVPGSAAIDLGDHGCPRVDDIGKTNPDLHEKLSGQQCRFHAPQTVKRRGRRVVHCPRLEVALFAGWVASSEAAAEAGSPDGPGS